MKVEGRLVGIEKCENGLKVFIKQFMSGIIYWGWEKNAKASKEDNQIILFDGNDTFNHAAWDLSELKTQNRNIKYARDYR